MGQGGPQDGQVVPFGTPARENDLVRFRPDERRCLPPGLFDSRLPFPPETVETRRVPEMPAEKGIIASSTSG